MSAKIFDGKLLITRLSSRIKRDAERLRRQYHIDVGLGILLVTGDQVSMSDAGKIAQTAEELGITVKMERVAQRNIGRKFFPTLEEYAESPFIQGIFIQQPLPTEIIPLDEVMKRLPPDKDVSGIHYINRGKATFPMLDGIFPVISPEVLAVFTVMKDIGYDFREGAVTVIGSSATSGQVRELAGFLYDKGVNVNLLKWESVRNIETGPHPRTLEDDTTHASAVRQILNPNSEVIITWTNQPSWLTGMRISHGSVIIDLGYKFARGRISGDCDFVSVSSRAGILTPVPGGIRNIIHLMIMQNLIELIKKQKGDAVVEAAKQGLKRRFSVQTGVGKKKLKG